MKKTVLALFAFSVLAGSLSAQVVGTGNGLNGRYWEGGSNFDKADHWGRTGTLTLDGVIVPQINFEWGEGNPWNKPGDFPFSCEWTGYIQAQYTGEYRFTQRKWDDGSGIRIWSLDDLENPIAELISWEMYVFNDPMRYIDVDLEAGKYYKIELLHYENEFGAQAILEWQCYEFEDDFSIVPQSQLYTELPGQSIGDNQVSDVEILNARDGVLVNGLNGEGVSVYTALGQVVYNAASAGSSVAIPLEKGIYIVKAGNKTVKVIR